MTKFNKDILTKLVDIMRNNSEALKLLTSKDIIQDSFDLPLQKALRFKSKDIVTITIGKIITQHNSLCQSCIFISNDDYTISNVYTEDEVEDISKIKEGRYIMNINYGKITLTQYLGDGVDDILHSDAFKSLNRIVVPNCDKVVKVLFLQYLEKLDAGPVSYMGEHTHTSVIFSTLIDMLYDFSNIVSPLLNVKNDIETYFTNINEIFNASIPCGKVCEKSYSAKERKNILAGCYVSRHMDKHRIRNYQNPLYNGEVNEAFKMFTGKKPYNWKTKINEPIIPEGIPGVAIVSHKETCDVSNDASDISLITPTVPLGVRMCNLYGPIAKLLTNDTAVRGKLPKYPVTDNSKGKTEQKEVPLDITTIKGFVINGINKVDVTGISHNGKFSCNGNELDIKIMAYNSMEMHELICAKNIINIESNNCIKILAFSIKPNVHIIRFIPGNCYMNSLIDCYMIGKNLTRMDEDTFIVQDIDELL